MPPTPRSLPLGPPRLFRACWPPAGAAAAAAARHRPMDTFPDSAHVRLRTGRRMDQYLLAKVDGIGVALSRHGAAIHAIWNVHRVNQDGTTYVALHGAAYGRYLALEPTAAPRRASACAACRMVQCSCEEENQDNLVWEPLEVEGRRTEVILKNVRYGPLCHGDGVLKRRWTIELVPSRFEPPLLPAPPEDLGRHRGQPHTASDEDQCRLIWYLFSDEPLNLREGNLGVLSFHGCSVHKLRTELGILANHGNIEGTRLCVQAGFYGRLTPLVTDLPQSDEGINIVVFTAESQDANLLEYPVVYAEG